MRIATFNGENLFTRAKVLNFKNNADGDFYLQKISLLQSELEKKIYDQPKILSLYKEVKDYIDIAEDRGKLFKHSGFKITGVVAKGVDDWDGSIVFKRESFSEMTRINTAKVVTELKADIQCMVEIENRIALSAFNANLLIKNKFPYNMLIDGNDDRGIDVGLFSCFPIKNIQTHIFDKKGRQEIFSRDCLVIELELPDKKSIHILCNHLKSQGYGAKASNDAKRKMQAERIRDILKSDFDLKKDYVVVAGDFNDSPDSKALAPLLSVTDLHDVLQLKFGNDLKKRWTYYYSSKYQQIDYILVSAALKTKWKDAGIEQRGIYDLNKLTKGVETSFPTVDKASNAASDHAGVWADFDL